MIACARPRMRCAAALVKPRLHRRNFRNGSLTRRLNRPLEQVKSQTAECLSFFVLVSCCFHQRKEGTFYLQPLSVIVPVMHCWPYFLHQQSTSESLCEHASQGSANFQFHVSFQERIFLLDSPVSGKNHLQLCFGNSTIDFSNGTCWDIKITKQRSLTHAIVSLSELKDLRKGFYFALS